MRGPGVVYPGERGPEVACGPGGRPADLETLQLDGVFVERDHLYDRSTRVTKPAQACGLGREEVGMAARRAAVAQRLDERGTHRGECSSAALASRLRALTRASRSKRSLATRIAIS